MIERNRKIDGEMGIERDREKERDIEIEIKK